MARSKLSKAQKRAAKLQLQEFINEHGEEEVSFGKRKKVDISNQEAIDEMKRARSQAKRVKRKQIGNARNEIWEIKKEEGPRAKVSYSCGYQPGDLVTITKRALKRYPGQIQYANLFEGATGVIVDQEDTSVSYNYQYEEGRYIQVMGPNGLQQWDVRWVEVLEEDED